MRIALAQLTATSDPQVNLAAIQERTVDAAAAGAELVVFPEASMAVFGSAARAAAESVDGPWAAAVAELARTQGITIVVGMFTTTASSRIQNTLLVAGEASASYQKLHLFDALGYAESDQIAPGDEPVWFDLGGHRLGLATCYDVRFPGLFTHLARRGAEVILVPAAWAPGEDKLRQWRTLVSARAMDSTSFVVAVDQSLSATGDRLPAGIGHSMVADPSGKLLLELGEADELAVIDLDLEVVAAVRERLPVLQHERHFE